MRRDVRRLLFLVLAVAWALGLRSFAPAAQAQSVVPLHSFAAAAREGLTPIGPPVQDRAGNFYGATLNPFTIFRITSDGRDTTLVDLRQAPGGTIDPTGALVTGPDGDLYGTGDGAPSGAGLIYKVTPTGGLTVLASLASGHGYFPQQLCLANDGNFYGTADSQDNSTGGLIFRMTPAGSLDVIYSFTVPDGNGKNTDGALPTGPLVQGMDGNLYGTATLGGANGEGTIYKISLGGQFGTVYTFTAADGQTDTNADGGEPNGGLVVGSDGSLYGTTESLGADGWGTVFKVTPAGVLTPLHSFDPDTAHDGSVPSGRLILAEDGYFYGATYQGGTETGGTVYRIDSQGDFFTTLYDFGEPTGPSGGLVEGGDGNFYGLSSYGGANLGGTLYQINSAGDLAIIHSFGLALNADGVTPAAPLLADSAGHLFGTTSAAGPGEAGTVFQVTTAGVFTTLFAFDPPGIDSVNADGGSPLSGLVRDSSGNLYGASSTGGTFGCGTFFELTPAGTFDVVSDFARGSNNNGSTPAGALARGSDGSCYGATMGGGEFGFGAIYKIDAQGDPTTLYSFAQFAPGGPTAGPFLAKDGNLYGTTPQGGPNNNGSIYQLTPGGAFTTLYGFTALASDGHGHFTNSDGANPAGPLTVGQDGNLYGTTANGGPSGLGAVFSISLSGSFALLHGLAPGEGSSPAGLVAQAGDSHFYVATQAGGANSTGVILQIIPGAGAIVMHDFAALNGSKVNAEGAQPTTGLVVGADGNLYGVAPVGGANGTGTVYALLVVPAITSSLDAVGHVGSTSFTYRITATNSPTSYAATNLPPGTKLNSATGLISGTPTTAGTFAMPVTATNACGTGTATVVLTIENPAGTLALDSSSYSVSENAGTISVHVQRTGGSMGAASVVCGTSSNTARAGTDYTGLSQTLTWASGDSAPKTFTVAIKDVGLTDDSTRQFGLKLSSATGASMGAQATATVTIQENDPLQGELALSSSAYRVAESAGTLTIPVDRLVGTSGPVSVTCSTSSATAKSGTDYIGKSQVLSWAAGDNAPKSFTITIKNRGVSGGGGLQFGVKLSSPGGGAVLGSPATGTITIN